MDPIPKPHELLAAREPAQELFAQLRSWFGVGTRVTLNLEAIDSAVAELGDTQLVMAMAMRKLQAFHLLTTPGVVTTTDVVLTVVQDLERALVQAPRSYLRNAAAAADWDAALAAIEALEGPEGAPRHRSPAAASSTTPWPRSPATTRRCAPPPGPCCRSPRARSAP